MEHANEKLNAIKYLLASNAKNVEKALETAKADPAYAFEWNGDDMAIGSFCMNLSASIKRGEDNGSSKEVIVTFVAKEALRYVLNGALMNSTSMTANAKSVYVRDFCVRLLDSIGFGHYNIEQALFPKE